MELILYAVGIILIILWAISLYLIKTGKMSAKDWSKKALGLPQGSVRAIIALAILSSLVYSIAFSKTIPDLPAWLVGILGTVIGFYFGSAMVPKAEELPKPEETKPTKP